MDVNKILQTLRLAKAVHRSFPSSKREMKILSAIVLPASRLLPSRIADGFHSVAFQRLTFMFNRTLKVMLFAVYFHKNLRLMPLPLRPGSQSFHAFLPYFSCEHRTKPVPPKSHRFVAEIDAPLVKHPSTFPDESGNQF